MTGDIQINTFDGFQRGLTALGSYRGDIDKKSRASKDVTAAAEAAISGTAAVGRAAGSAGAAKTCYATTLTALKTACDGVGTHVDHANQSLTGALTDMQTLLGGMRTIDRDGAKGVTDI